MLSHLRNGARRAPWTSGILINQLILFLIAKMPQFVAFLAPQPLNTAIAAWLLVDFIQRREIAGGFLKFLDELASLVSTSTILTQPSTGLWACLSSEILSRIFNPIFIYLESKHQKTLQYVSLSFIMRSIIVPSNTIRPVLAESRIYSSHWYPAKSMPLFP